MDKLSTTTIYNLGLFEGVVRFIPTGFTDGDERLFYVIKESPHDQLEPGNVVSMDVFSVKDIELVFGVKLSTTSMPISHTIKTTPNDKELGCKMRDRQVEFEKNNPTFEFEKYQN